MNCVILIGVKPLHAIESSKFFQPIDERNRQILASICFIRQLEKKEILFWEEDLGNSFFILLSGAIQLYNQSDEGKEVVIKVIHPNEMFGEVILTENDHYPVTSIALTQSNVLGIPKDGFLRLLGDEEFRLDFIGLLFKKMRYLTNQLVDLTSYDVETRFLRYIKKTYGSVNRIVIPYSKRELASTIGTTPESLSRTLHQLRNDGICFWEGDTLIFKEGFWNMWDDQL
jgi:CRP/FNR family transcriptional regulator, dissimilatory nitrate respiration regulator